MSAEWELLAERISARYRGRDSLIRGVAVLGDYARHQEWDGSLLQILLIRHRDEALVDEGGITTENGIAAVVDTITSGVFVELEGLLQVEPLAANLADMRALRMADPALRSLLAAFRDRYYSADGRRQRAAQALQRARVALDDAAASGQPIHAIDAVRTGIFPAVSALVGEPVDFLRMPRRMRAAGRLLKMLELWQTVADALRLSESEGSEDALRSTWEAVDRLRALCSAHLEARLPEVGAALTPRLERGAAPARAGSGALLAAGDLSGAAWCAISAAADIDGVIEAASPGWRERRDYQERARAIYGEPQIEALRRVCVDLQRRID